MTTTVFSLVNRSGLTIQGQISTIGAGRPLALVLHGLGDKQQAPVVQALMAGLLKAGYNVVTWDATNSTGASDGLVEHATLSGKRSDLEDVYEWASGQDLVAGPVMLAGHSMGGAAALQFAAARPKAVGGLLLAAPFVSGPRIARQLNRIGRTIWRIRGHVSVPQLGGRRYNYGLLRDALDYDGLSVAPNVTSPVMVLAPALDRLLPIFEQRLLFAALPAGLRELVVIEHATHNLKEDPAAVTAASYRFALRVLNGLTADGTDGTSVKSFSYSG